MGAAQPTTLTGPEQNLIYNLEVLNLPLVKAADLAGCPIGRANRPEVITARRQLRRELAGRMAVTKEDAINGIQDAIDRAKLLDEPSTQIKGWEAISKMMGWDAPQTLNVNVNGVVEITKKNLRELSDAQLIEQLGAGNVIDGDFYRVG